MRFKEFLNKRFPTILGLLLLLLGVAGGVFLVRREQLFGLKAGPELTPRKVRLSNITENSFTVSWVTDEETSGFLRYGETSEAEFTATDERDQMTDETGLYLTHYITVRGLKPESPYYFKLGSGRGKTLFDNNGQPYQLRTAAVADSLPVADPVTGTVISSADLPFEGALVYLSVEGSSLLSTRTLENGSWALSLSTVRTQDLFSYLTYDSETAVVNIEVEGGGEVATALVNTANDNPVSAITLGQSYDFREPLTSEEEEPESPSPGFSFADLEEPTEATSPQEATSSADLVVLNPFTEGEVLHTLSPEFRGKAPAGVVISIKVESEIIYTGSVTVDEEGNWQWTPPADLEPGIHEITLSYIDGVGDEQTMTRSFVILAAGESGLPAFESTPSGETTPSATASPSAEPRTSMPATEGGIPQPGVLTPTFFLFIMGASLLIGGVILKFLIPQFTNSLIR